MANPIPPALLAELDQDIAKLNGALDMVLAAFREHVKATSREYATVFLAAQYARMGFGLPLSRLFAVTVSRLAEAEEPRGG